MLLINLYLLIIFTWESFEYVKNKQRRDTQEKALIYDVY